MRLFDHSTSRAGDPQLHTHCLAINLGADASGRLGAIDRYVLNKYKIPAGSIYRLALRAELGKLGLAFEPPNASGLAELRGMPTGLLRHYSTRRRKIEAHLNAQVLDDQGEDGAVSAGSGLRRSAAVATRAKKPTGRSAAESEDVSARLRPLFADTVDPWLWDQVFGTPSAPAPIEPARASRVLGQLLGPDGPLSNMSSWSRHSLIARLATVLPEGATPEGVDQLVELIEADDTLVPLVYVDPKGQVATRASVGDLRLAVATEVDRSVTSTLGLRHASKALVAEEHAILVAAATWTWPTGQRERVAAEKVLAGAFDGDLSPTAEQAELVRHFVGSDRAITLGVGVPGSGKTTAMCLCVEAWKRLIDAGDRPFVQGQVGPGVEPGLRSDVIDGRPVPGPPAPGPGQRHPRQRHPGGRGIGALDAAAVPAGGGGGPTAGQVGASGRRPPAPVHRGGRHVRHSGPGERGGGAVEKCAATDRLRAGGSRAAPAGSVRGRLRGSGPRPDTSGRRPATRIYCRSPSTAGWRTGRPPPHR